MSLSNRLTVFFLACLAVVLAGFSGTLYVLARTHLFEQLEARAAATMDTLVAAAEVEPDGLDWEPELRRLPSRWQGDPPVWAVHDEYGTRLDGSHDPTRRLSEYAAPGADTRDDQFFVVWGGDEWRVDRHTIRHPTPEVVRDPAPGRRKTRHRTLIFVNALPLTPVHISLRALAWSLAGISVGLWVVAAVACGRLCRRGLLPLARMSATANALTADDLGGRVPCPGTGDELESLAVAFNGLLARLQDAFERQRRFAGEASHQLRTPLTALLGQIEVALRRDRPEQDYRSALESARRQATRMRQIVEALLFIARADADAELPGRAAFDLVGWLPRHVAEAWSDHPRYRELRLDIAGAITLPVLAHPTLLGQALDNLIDNGLKYSLPGSAVRIHLRGASEGAEITVTDEGPGIAPAEVERVFDPFFRSEDARRRGVVGLGLGLAVVVRIVTVLGGRVRAESRPGEGGRFVVWLPAASGAERCQGMGE